jgi:hypothetical protein
VPQKRKRGSGKTSLKAVGAGAGRKSKVRPKKTAARKAPAKKAPARKRRPAAAQPASRARAAKIRESPDRDRREPVREREDAEILIPGAREDDLAEELGEESVEAATSGEAPGEDNLNQEVPEETGGPFVETTIETETGHRGDRRRDK